MTKYKWVYFFCKISYTLSIMITILKNYLNAFLLSVWVFLFSLFLFPGSVFAATPTTFEPSKELYGKCSSGFLDLRPTVCGVGTAFIDWGFRSVMANHSLDEVGNCVGRIPGYTGYCKDCASTPEVDCKGITNTLVDAEGSIAESRTGGSLLGMAYTLSNINDRSPVPTNMALFWNDTVGKIPFAGTVLAAQIDYKNPLINSIYTTWKVIRDISYGLLGLVLLYIGFTIILRKKIDQQTVVSVQYAIPNIVISIFLITFSYPIGAVLTSLGWTLYQSAGSMLDILMGPFQYNFGQLAIMVLVQIVFTFGVGALNLAILLVLFVAIIVMWLIFNIKVYLLFLKMLVSVVTSPLTFLMSAVPGSTTNYIDWFKRMLANVISLFCMGSAYWLIVRLGFDILLATTANNLPNSPFQITKSIGVALSSFGIPFIFIYSFAFCIGIPAKIELVILGDPKKKK